MYLKTLLCALLSGMAVAAYAQQGAAHYCAAAKQGYHPLTANKGTIADVGESNYDVKYVKLDISLPNNSNSISGNALTRVLITTATNEYVFELTSDLTIDSVTIDGLRRTFTRTGDVCKVSLPVTASAGTSLEARVFYRGTVPNSSSQVQRGLRYEYSSATGLNYTYTLGEPYVVKDWWPCKQDLQDKIDSCEVWITVDSVLKAGSNGLLQNITRVTPTKKRYEWKHASPIDYYLISATAGRYTDYSYYMHFNNSTDSMLIQNYIYPNALIIRRPILDSVALMVNYFSDIFGRYPFWKEKYGHCQAPLQGGEEHQTMTTIGVWTNEVVPHELAHQWFGDHVTCGTWQDLWLNEGFASYAEYLHIEHFKPASASAKMLEVHHDAMYEPFSAVSDPTGAVYVDDTTDIDRLFSSRLTYNKGSSIIHTLRFEANNDALFFNTLRLYQQQYAHGTATTEQFKTLVAQQYGRNMDTFFNQWIYSSGWPVYNAVWNQKNGIVIVQLSQQATGNYTAHKYSTPIELRFTSLQGDTTIRFQTNDNATTFSFLWNKTMQGLTIDPNDWLLDEPGLITKNNSLGIEQVAGEALHLYPNPVQDYLHIRATGNGRITIMDISGKTLIETVVNNDTQINVQQLSAGIYLYRLQGKDGRILEQGKLVKQ